MKFSSVLLAVIPLLAFTPLQAFAETMTLDQTLAESYRNNPSLEAERAKLRATDEQVSIAQSHWMPNVAATGNVGKTYQYLPAETALGTANYDSTTHSVGLQVTQPLFRGFRTQSETEAAEKQVRAGRAQLQTAEEQLLLDTSTSFLDTVRDQNILANDQENEHVLGEKLNETNARAKVGDLTQTDIRQAESRLARAQAGTLQAHNSLTTDKDNFERLVGVEPGELKDSELMLPAGLKMEDALVLAEKNNPNVIAAQYAVEAANADIDSNKGSLLPEVDLVGNTSRSYGESTTTPGRFDSSQVLLQLTVPLYPTGANYARVRAAQQTSVQHRMERDNAVRRAHENARNAWEAFVTNDAVVKADKREIEAASEALKGVRVQSHAGTRTTLDVLNAEQELLDAKTDLVKSEHDRNLAVLQIKAAIGELTADALNLPVDTYDPTRHYNHTRGRFIGFDDAEEDIYLKPNTFKASLPSSESTLATSPSHGLVIPKDDTLVTPGETVAAASDQTDPSSRSVSASGGEIAFGEESLSAPPPLAHGPSVASGVPVRHDADASEDSGTSAPAPQMPSATVAPPVLASERAPVSLQPLSDVPSSNGVSASAEDALAQAAVIVDESAAEAKPDLLMASVQEADASRAQGQSAGAALPSPSEADDVSPVMTAKSDALPDTKSEAPAAVDKTVIDDVPEAAPAAAPIAQLVPEPASDFALPTSTTGIEAPLDALPISVADPSAATMPGLSTSIDQFSHMTSPAPLMTPIDREAIPHVVIGGGMSPQLPSNASSDASHSTNDSVSDGAAGGNLSEGPDGIDPSRDIDAPAQMPDLSSEAGAERGHTSETSPSSLQVNPAIVFGPGVIFPNEAPVAPEPSASSQSVTTSAPVRLPAAPGTDVQPAFTIEAPLAPSQTTVPDDLKPAPGVELVAPVNIFAPGDQP